MALAPLHVGAMYCDFYGLREAPFTAAPDPRFLYLNDSYRAALAALDEGIVAREEPVSLIGEAGTGKTTLLRRVLDGLEPRINAVLLLNPRVSFDEILEYLLFELGVPAEGCDAVARRQRVVEVLRRHARAGETVALLIDDAQLLADDVLRELGGLVGTAAARGTPLRVVLAGQPELDAKLAEPSLGSFGSRVRLRPLSPAEVHAYVRARLERAGGVDSELFTGPALDRIAALSAGVPRVVNTLCDAALLGAFTAGRRRVCDATVDEAWRDWAGDDQPPPTVRTVRRAVERAGLGRRADGDVRHAGIDGVVDLSERFRTVLGAVDRVDLERAQADVAALANELERYGEEIARLRAIAAALGRTGV